MKSPFPEEMNRSLTGVLANIHFAPTETSGINLIRDNKKKESILITGVGMINSAISLTKELTRKRYDLVINMANIFKLGEIGVANTMSPSLKGQIYTNWVKLV